MRPTLAVLILLAVAATPLAARVSETEAAAIEEVIQAAYVDGLWLQGDEKAARGGFDPAFVMLVARQEGTLSVSLDAWLERLGLSGQPLDKGISHEIKVLDQIGDAAVARVRVYRDGEPLYTDYMSLYRSDAGWKIVAKTFHSHD